MGYIRNPFETFKKNTVKSHGKALGLYIQGHKGFWVGLYLGGIKAKKKKGWERRHKTYLRNELKQTYHYS